MLTLPFVLIVSALVVTIAAGMGKAPLWVAVFLLVMVHLLDVLPR